ncbi:histone-lysine N-methyltransferase SETMAR-like [Episyrphus balteatus]|uniref:histone-lysine N-methyltransferase SETMAR-like n=1 Tax=Episyrphus balteatus TaxID=286459 RepID=UPI0024863181|nr:histone-lysine N-methyltransferase SETMAR-like [Episyrphus balteatus]XP_055845166.1 histone-lysine N-methyltransferase SETMAR-like [Episyrphus balteatus]
MNDIIIELEVCMHFCCANEKNYMQALDMLKKTYGNGFANKTHTYARAFYYKHLRKMGPHEACQYYPPDIGKADIVEKVKQLLIENRLSSDYDIARECHITSFSASMILTDILRVRGVGVYQFLRELNSDLKDSRKQFSSDMLARSNSDPKFMERIITGGETFFYVVNEFTRKQNENLDGRKPVECSPDGKVLFIAFFNINGLVHYEVLQAEQFYYSGYYLEVLKRLSETIRHKLPDLWKNKSWILHDNNAPSHRIKDVIEFKTLNGIQTIDQPPFSPDLSPYHFFFYHQFKNFYPRDSPENIKISIEKNLRDIRRTAFQKCFDDWKKHWNLCINSNGDYTDVIKFPPKF